MVTKTGVKSARMYRYNAGTSKSRKTFLARNIQEAYKKAGRLFPKAKLVTVFREGMNKHGGYETYIVSR